MDHILYKNVLKTFLQQSGEDARFH